MDTRLVIVLEVKLIHSPDGLGTYACHACSGLMGIYVLATFEGFTIRCANPICGFESFRQRNIPEAIQQWNEEVRHYGAIQAGAKHKFTDAGSGDFHCVCGELDTNEIHY